MKDRRFAAVWGVCKVKLIPIVQSAVARKCTWRREGSRARKSKTERRKEHRGTAWRRITRNSGSATDRWTTVDASDLAFAFGLKWHNVTHLCGHFHWLLLNCTRSHLRPLAAVYTLETEATFRLTQKIPCLFWNVERRRCYTTELCEKEPLLFLQRMPVSTGYRNCYRTLFLHWLPGAKSPAD